MLIAEMKVGNAIMRGYDDSFRSKEECEEILKNLGRISSSIYKEKEEKEEAG